MSTEFQQIINNDHEDRIEAEVAENANKTPVTIPTDFADNTPTPEEPKQPEPTKPEPDEEPF